MTTQATTLVNVREPYDVYIGRPNARIPHAQWGPWGNPYIIGRDGTREQVIAKYASYLPRLLRREPRMYYLLAHLKGKRLGCWCPPLPCHGEPLVRLIEELWP